MCTLIINNKLNELHINWRSGRLQQLTSACLHVPLKSGVRLEMAHIKVQYYSHYNSRTLFVIDKSQQRLLIVRYVPSVPIVEFWVWFF